ncbi:MAG TPA: cupredoxin domain-containing protein [Acidimicrobiales bacterium]|nr:cupredoxin domain-containing protein [Acidimicrobiales bacterium]
MNRIGRLTVAAGLSAGLALGLTACGGGSSTKASSASGTAGAAASGGDTIVIKNFEFMPMSMTAKAGATVSVHNEDSTTHTLNATNGAFTTGDIGPGATKTFTVPSKAGKYSYDCQIHQYMTGTLTVTG